MQSNIVLVHIYLESGCSQENDEVSVSWTPLNFMIYDPAFQDMVTDCAGDWMSDKKLETEVLYSFIANHVVERDGAGANLGEYFEPISGTEDQDAH